ncbi:sulfurtransferase [Alcaligenes nematophilus]|uniref:sulfurtransferase n=1 Tax=Alcaligenes nematophilus TaxID=2994643 RepID=UPI003850A2D8
MIKPILISLAFAFSAVLAPTASAEPSTPDTAAKPAALISAGDLATKLDQNNLRILDIRTDKEYAAGHVPGAVHTPYGAYRGPSENAGALRSEAELSALFSKAGISKDSYVVVTYAGANPTDFGAAARVYWTLKAGGLTQLSILDGGLQAWEAEGKALSKDTPTVTPTEFSYHYNKDMVVSTQEVADYIKNGQAPVLLDARPTEFFKGEKRVDAAARYGTLPGARELDFNSFFRSDKPVLKDTGELVKIVKEQGLDDKPTVSFCNTGHWAATNWFVLSELAGNPNVKLYPESVVEWSRSNLPMDNQPSRFEVLKLDAKRAIN